jgi:hypothetical protein
MRRPREPDHGRRQADPGAENLLLTFTGIGKDVFPGATKAVVDLGIAMAGGDVNNANFKASAIQVGKALNDPIKGVTALSKVGVSFTKQQKDQIKALVKRPGTRWTRRSGSSSPSSTRSSARPARLPGRARARHGVGCRTSARTSRRRSRRACCRHS